VTGGAFFVDAAGDEHLRLSFSAPPPQRIEEGVARLSEAIEEAHESAATSAAGPAS
jgi:DNA-binding transcriptional MocR family regulator